MLYIWRHGHFATQFANLDINRTRNSAVMNRSETRRTMMIDRYQDSSSRSSITCVHPFHWRIALIRTIGELPSYACLTSPDNRPSTLIFAMLLPVQSSKSIVLLQLPSDLDIWEFTLDEFKKLGLRCHLRLRCLKVQPHWARLFRMNRELDNGWGEKSRF